MVLDIYYLNANDISWTPSFLKMDYLWFNLVGCGLVIFIGLFVQGFMKKK
ncbi:MAG: hypothetical protein ACI9XP_000199 [Lentimonas sp.]|jgi:hypothetical protein